MVTTAKPKKAQLLIRGIDPAALEALRARAKRNHRSMAAEARALIEALTLPDEGDDARQARHAETIRVFDEIRARQRARAQKSGADMQSSVDVIREAREERWP